MPQDIVIRNSVKIFGNGLQPMVFAHGFGCDQSFWRFVTPAFEQDYRVVLFDYVGSGKSDYRAYDLERYSSLDGYAQDVIDVCQALHLKDAIFVGHSISATIGMLAFLRAPQLFERFVFIGASPCYVNDPPDYMGGYARADLEGLLEMMERNYLGWANYVAPAAMKNVDRPELASELEDSFNSTDHFIMQRFAAATFLQDTRACLSKVKRPALIMQTCDDIFVPPSVADYLHIQLPHSTLVWMQASGHFPHLSSPDETVQVIKKYLLVANPA